MSLLWFHIPLLMTKYGDNKRKKATTTKKMKNKISNKIFNDITWQNIRTGLYRENIYYIFASSSSPHHFVCDIDIYRYIDTI